MSDDNKDLGNDLNDMLDDAKDNARKAGDKISQKANEFSDDAKEFGRDAKRAADDFGNDAKEVFSDGKNVAIIAHITFIGWIIAIVMNSSNKTEFGSFYIRQMLGLVLIAVVSSWIPIINLIMWLVLLIAWIMSIIAALGGEMKPTFLFGKQFQEWFKGL
ncbi:YtxH domain-containing protein [Winogradskyella pacifica]|uniref:YtxH domain-containing protein n=1 Tax=Winogradskyella pacifica TaxID=664642 RepID=UPI0015C75312|nr:YtxH domain-containing protein [Winogradskyella pacifica]